MPALHPLEDNVLIEVNEQEETTKHWFILPDSNKEKPSHWRVVAVWAWKILENWTRAPIDVKEGDTVYFTKYSPNEIEVTEGDETKTYLVVSHSSLLAVEK